MVVLHNWGHIPWCTYMPLSFEAVCLNLLLYCCLLSIPVNLLCGATRDFTLPRSTGTFISHLHLMVGFDQRQFCCAWLCKLLCPAEFWGHAVLLKWSICDVLHVVQCRICMPMFTAPALMTALHLPLPLLLFV